MFGISEKEYERIKSKTIIFNNIIEKSTQDFIILGNNILRKSFVHKIYQGKQSEEIGTYISYFDFELKGYLDRMTKDIFIRESEVSFQEIKALF